MCLGTTMKFIIFLFFFFFRCQNNTQECQWPFTVGRTHCHYGTLRSRQKHPPKYSVRLQVSILPLPTYQETAAVLSFLWPWELSLIASLIMETNQPAATVSQCLHLNRCKDRSIDHLSRLNSSFLTSSRNGLMPESTIFIVFVKISI